ncbi:hypothetical protein BD560DRAFT_405100 [Blakeslea trispora]|nr:hypothetical protein BD560DRAFT_405100 [Blakeslea trispora]
MILLFYTHVSLFLICTASAALNYDIIVENDKDMFSSLLKRQAIASRTCGSQNNSVAICSPNSDSVWTNNTDQEITWKYNNPVFNSFDTLDLYLLYRPNDSIWQPLLKWPGLDKTKGVFITHVNDSWYPAPLASNNSNVTWTMQLYLTGSGYDYQSDLELIPSSHNYFPAPQPFTLIQSSSETTVPSTTVTSSTTTDSPTSTSTSDSSSNPTANKLPGWAIAVICIAALLFVAAVAALIWAYRRYKQRKNRKSMIAVGLAHRGQREKEGDEEKVPVLTPSKNESNVAISNAVAPANSNANHTATAVGAGLLAANASMHSSTHHLVTPQPISPRHHDEASSFVTVSEKPPLGTHNEAHHSSSILSSTDALMIADTFRQFMRKPEWNEEMELNAQRQQIEEKGESGEEIEHEETLRDNLSSRKERT